VYLCEICAAAVALKAAPSAESSRRRVEQRDETAIELLHEVQDIKRALTYRPFSPWYLLAAVVQAMAVGSIVIGYSVGQPTLGLLWAVFCQLVALTLFVLGRQ
jgi:hypothetical protein